jgi:hypothetical protein
MQDHPKDAEFLNCPIRFYSEMEAIFANVMTTGKFALGFGEALGQKSAGSVAGKADGPILPHSTIPSEQVGIAKPLKCFLPAHLLLALRGREGTSLRMKCSC